MPGIEFVVPHNWSVTGEPGETTSVDDAAYSLRKSRMSTSQSAATGRAKDNCAPKPLFAVDVVTSTEFGPFSTTVSRITPSELT